jgi:Collagen triple helix repeat (20 copies)
VTAHRSGSSRRVRDVRYAVTVLLGLAAFAFLLILWQAQANDLRVEREYNRALAQQVRDLGGKPVAGPPGSQGLPGESVTGPSGLPGKQGEPGASGEPAPAPSPGPSGASGRDGVDGSPGAPGAVGPTGPVGSQGEQGVPGAAGQDGQDGADGRDGVDGKDGQSCPDGYSLQAPADDPDALVCRRDGAPDPSEPAQGAGLLALWAVTQRRYV